MSSQELNPDIVQPAWFETWRKKEEKRRAKHEMRETGFNVFAVGLGAIAVGLGMATLESIREIDIAEVIVLGISAMAMGLVFVFLSRWAAVREERE